MIYYSVMKYSSWRNTRNIIFLIVYDTQFQFHINHILLLKKIGADATATARAGLLHDLFYYDWRVTKFEEGSHAYVHPRIALENAQKITHINDKEADIIVKHMFGATIALPKYRESWIVSLVDDFAAVNEYMIPKAYLTYFAWHTKWVKKVAEVFA